MNETQEVPLLSLMLIFFFFFWSTKGLSQYELNDYEGGTRGLSISSLLGKNFYTKSSKSVLSASYWKEEKKNIF